jgi:hypothetical protein
VDFMCYPAPNRCTAKPLFNLPTHDRGGSCWVIQTNDDDAAFGLHVRWL